MVEHFYKWGRLTSYFNWGEGERLFSLIVSLYFFIKLGGRGEAKALPVLLPPPPSYAVPGTISVSSKLQSPTLFLFTGDPTPSNSLSFVGHAAETIMEASLYV